MIDWRRDLSAGVAALRRQIGRQFQKLESLPPLPERQRRTAHRRRSDDLRPSWMCHLSGRDLLVEIWQRRCSQRRQFDAPALKWFELIGSCRPPPDLSASIWQRRIQRRPLPNQFQHKRIIMIIGALWIVSYCWMWHMRVVDGYFQDASDALYF